MFKAQSIAGQMLETIFEGNIPPFFTEHIRTAQVDSLICDFKLVAVLPLGTPQPIRCTWSSLGEADYWCEVVQQLLPPNADRFLNAYPDSCRKVLDSDGTWGEIFLDDLSIFSERSTLLSRVYSLDGVEIAKIRKIDSPLAMSLPVGIILNPYFIGCVSFGGMWCVREDAIGQLRSVLWISEAKWQDSIPKAQAVIERKGAQEHISTWFALKERMNGYGLQIYPDGIEFFLDGRIDLSVAFA